MPDCVLRTKLLVGTRPADRYDGSTVRLHTCPSRYSSTEHPTVVQTKSSRESARRPAQTPRRRHSGQGGASGIDPSHTTADVTAMGVHHGSTSSTSRTTIPSTNSSQPRAFVSDPRGCFLAVQQRLHRDAEGAG